MPLEEKSNRSRSVAIRHQFACLHERRLVSEVVHTVVQTTASSGRATVNTTCQDGFARHTTIGMNILPTDRRGVRVGDPGHFTFASTHVWGWHVDAGTNETLLGQLDGQSSSDTLQFTFGPI